MRPKHVMALDCGGGGGRCLILDTGSGATTVASRPWRHPAAPDTGGWGLVLDVARLQRALGEAAREALASAGIGAADVAAVAVTAMRHGTVLVDEGGQVVWGVPNRDARAAGQASDLAARLGSEIHRRTGHWPSPICAPARLLWLREHHPASLDRAHRLLDIGGWLGSWLSGQAAMDPSQAAESSLFDLAAGDWARDLVESLGLPTSLLPALVQSGAPLGVLGEPAADSLGLNAGTPVVAGGADTQCALLALGATAPGDTALVAGTTLPLQRVLGEPSVDPKGRTWTGRHVVEGRWVLESNAGAGGQALDWLAELLSPADPMGAAMLVADATAAPPGAAGVTSTLGAELFNAAELQLPVGDLTLSHIAAGVSQAPRRHVARAMLEGLAFGVQANLEQLREVAGPGTEVLHLTGGLSRSDTWCRILANVCDRPVQTTATHHGSLLGAALCAATGAGLAGSLPEAVEGLGAGRRFEPDAGERRIYAGLYEDWQRLGRARSEAGDLAAEGVLRAVAAQPEPREEAPVLAGTFRPRILVTAKLDDDTLDRLRELGDIEVAPYMEVHRLLTGDELVEALDGVHVFVTEVDVVDGDSLRLLPDLRAVFVCRGNPVNVDVEACTAHGVPVMNAPGRNARAVAEWVLGVLLMLARKIGESARFLREPGGEAGDVARMGMAHERFEGWELGGKTVGLVGFGAVARALVPALRGLGVQVLAFDPFVTDEATAALGAARVELDELLRRSDAVSLHAPVTPQTRGMIGAEQLRTMKAGALLVNSARAALLDQDALLAALSEGHLGGAALDVFAVEPPGANDPLLALPNVVATPHIAGNTTDVARHQGAMVRQAVEALLGGGRPRTVCNPEVLARFGWTGPRREPSAEELRALEEAGGPAVTDLEAEAEAEEQTDGPAQKSEGLWSKMKSRIRGAAPPVSAAAGGAAGPATAEVAAAQEKLGAILRAFFGKVEADEAVAAFSRDKAVTVLYRVPDVELTFHTAFRGEHVRCAMGEPKDRPELTLKMDAHVLDDVFMERTSGMRAAMSGKMSFTGNTMKAMALQRIQRHLNRAWKEAREEVGDPGDLKALSEARRAASTSAPTAAARVAAQATAKVGDERDEMFELVEELFEAGLITSTGGNVSMRCPDRPGEIWITPSAMPKGSLGPDLLVRVDLDGQPLDEDGPSPSSERMMHCTILRDRPDLAAVVHSHSPSAIVLGLAGLPFSPISTEAAFFGDIPRIPFRMPGSDDLAEAAATALGTGNAVMLLNHGLLVAGSSLRRAVDMTHIVEETCAALLRCQALGVEPPTLPEDVLQMLRELGELIA